MNTDEYEETAKQEITILEQELKTSKQELKTARTKKSRRRKILGIYFLTVIIYMLTPYLIESNPLSIKDEYHTYYPMLDQESYIYEYLNIVFPNNSGLQFITILISFPIIFLIIIPSIFSHYMTRNISKQIRNLTKHITITQQQLNNKRNSLNSYLKPIYCEHCKIELKPPHSTDRSRIRIFKKTHSSYRTITTTDTTTYKSGDTSTTEREMVVPHEYTTDHYLCQNCYSHQPI